MTRIALAAIAGVALSGLASAQSKKSPTHDEAQAKVDANKVRVCKLGKKTLAVQKENGRCSQEADEAARLTCTPETSKQVVQLVKRCNKAVQAKPPRTAP